MIFIISIRSIEMIQYVEFQKTGDTLVEKVLNFVPEWLKKILQTKGLRLTTSQAVGHPNVYIIMVMSFHDHLLIELAQKYQFPRGFPMLVVLNDDQTINRVQTFGFYPKFSNDHRQQHNGNDFKDAQEISFFLKWSGFLVQVIAFEISKGQYCWTVCSKNSVQSNNPFVQYAHELISPFITEDLLITMVNDRIYFCGEGLHFADQVHGYKYKKQTCIVTMISNSRVFTKENRSETIVNFGKHYSYDSLIDFCRQHNLHCDSSVTIKGEQLQSFITTLTKERDLMDLSKLQTLVKCGTIKEGTINHKEIESRVIEGLVLKIVTNSETKFVKYKFPIYTVRTFLLRDLFDHDDLSDTTIAVKALDYVKYWCVSPEGQQYWYNFALSVIRLYQNNAVYQTVKDRSAHISLSDLVLDTGFDNSRVIDDQIPKIPIIVVTGPIGSGKSTWASKFDSTKYSIIDGDLLDLNREDVLILGKERQPYTYWHIVKSLMNNKIPVISCGGGIFFDKTKFTLENYLYRVFKMKIELILLQLDVPYSDTERVAKVINHRLNTRDWKLPKDKNRENFIKFICDKSYANQRFSDMLTEKASQVFMLEGVTKENYTQDKNLPALKINLPAPLNPLFTQVRFLVRVNDEFTGHITVKYSDTPFVYSKEDFVTLGEKSKLLKEDSSGFIISIPDKKIKVAIPTQKLHEDGSTHITMDPGSFQPKDMKDIAKAVYTDKNSVFLNQRKVSIPSQRIPCSIKVLGYFAI